MMKTLKLTDHNTDNNIAFRSTGSLMKSTYNKLADFEAQVIGLFIKLVQDITQTTKGTTDRSAATRNFETFMRNAPKAVIPKLPVEPLMTLVRQESGYLGFAQDFARAGTRAEKLLPLAEICRHDDAGTAIALIRILYESGTPPAVLLPSLKNLVQRFADFTNNTDDTEWQRFNPDIRYSVIETVTAMTYGHTVDPDVYGVLQEINSDPLFAEHAYKVQPALQRIDQSMGQYIDALNETLQASGDLNEPSALGYSEKFPKYLP